MKENTDQTTCDRANDLVSFLYNEMIDGEAREFRVHLDSCQNCLAEFRSFSEMRNAITDWKYEALSGFSVSSVGIIAGSRKKSAMAALRTFFDLSPLWMKSAVGFAGVAFCVLAVVAVLSFQRQQAVPTIPSGPTARTYDQQQVDAMIAKVRDEQKSVQTNAAVVNAISAEHRVLTGKQTGEKKNVPQFARSRRPLTRSEREQLAADLRLASANDDGFYLISDRIND